MNKTILSTITTVAGLMVSMPLLAHDPSQHKGDNTQPDCEAMKTMDHSGMDRNDPVMMAMMKKCMHLMHGEPRDMDMKEEHDKKLDKGEKPHAHAGSNSKQHEQEHQHE